ncbi:MAG: hypothetical protein HOQ24_14225 [Mycobacteriaceae bacterium]|nr:hypothetical protein [Mycobacteriaceae bacterium]
MRHAAGRVLSSAALVAAAYMVAAAPGAVAVDEVRLTPDSVAPGQQLDIRVACPEGAATAESPATPRVRLEPAADGGMFGDPVIARNTEPGDYTMTVRCGMRVLFVPFTVHADRVQHFRTGTLSRAMAWALAVAGLVASAAGLLATHPRWRQWLRAEISARLPIRRR